MATSSIFAGFDIRDKETAERFVKALEESANGLEWKPIAPVSRLLQIRMRFWNYGQKGSRLYERIVR